MTGTGLKNKIGGISLAKQLIFAISLMMFVVLSAVIGLFYQRTIRVITRQQADSEVEILSLKRRNFENYFAQLENYSMLLRYNSRIYSMVSADKPLSYADSAYLKSALRDAFYSRGDIAQYELCLLNNRTCYGISKAGFNVRTVSLKSPENDVLYRKAASASNYLYFRAENKSDGRMLTLCRVFINIINRKPLAFVKITVDGSFLKSLSEDGGGIQGLLGLIGPGDTLYYAENPQALNAASLSAMKRNFSAGASSGSFPSRILGTDYLSVYSTSSDSRWRFLSLIPQYALRKTTVQTRNLSLLMAFTAFLVTAALIFFMTKAQLKPLRKLAKQMQLVGKGDFTARVDGGGNAEVNDLSRQFNLMNVHIADLIKKNYVAELNEKTARLKALEAQIDPHFLYNTLQAISTEAVLSGQQNIRQMVEALASMLRYSVQHGNLVPLNTEMKHVKDYLFLQSARFEERLAYRIDAPPACGEFLIPKISVQVLVENSIRHGLENSVQQILIVVSTKRKDGFLHITVTDDGGGMSAERLREVKGMTEPDRANGSGIGLTNLASRLKILYGGRASFSIQSAPGSGTSVELVLPETPEKKEGEDNVPFFDR